MHWRLAESGRKPQMAVFVSKLDHCLADLLYRYQSGELHCEIPIILSNHEDTRWLAETYGVPLSARPCRARTTRPRRRRCRWPSCAMWQRTSWCWRATCRCCQPDFIHRYPNRIINIHHSFLPAFHGAKPYHRAFERGVKLIGATSHYVTEVLDDGPIIDQDVTRISHRDALEDLVQKGADLEKIVLSRAVRWHIDNRVLVYANKTVVFD